jgi:hypothetical protein
MTQRCGRKEIEAVRVYNKIELLSERGELPPCKEILPLTRAQVPSPKRRITHSGSISKPPVRMRASIDYGKDNPRQPVCP